MKNDDLGDRMKLFEKMEAGRCFMPKLPICIRIDGKTFSKWTKGLKRPYDERLVQLMVHTTERLVEETNALVGYTQSDEISLILYSEDHKSQVFFDGKIQKIVSVLASMATVYFNDAVPIFVPEKKSYLALFDARAWIVPSPEEAVNNLLWRELDATRNSVSMAAQHYFSHKSLQGKSCNEMQDVLMLEKGVNWNDYPAFFKRGTYIRRQKVVRKFTVDELEKLPEKHEARKNPNLEVERTEIKKLEMPPIRRVENRVEVFFGGEDPREK